MRVLTFTSLFPNAARPTLGVFIHQRMAHLARRPSNVVEVVGPVPYFPSSLPISRWQPLSQIPKQEKIGELTVHHPRYLHLPRVSMPVQGLMMFLGSVRLVSRLHKDIKFDCIDAHFVYPDGFAAALLGWVLNLPVVISARGTDINLYPSYRIIRPMIRWSLERATGIISVCQALKNVMVELGNAPDKIRVIGNGVDVRRFEALEQKEAREKLGLPVNAKIVVAVGSLIPRKGYHLLISAIAEIAQRQPRLFLYIAGEGDFRSALEALIREKGLGERVFLVGNRPNEELAWWYSAADISCLTSSREGWPNVILESLACGTPVVATRVWGVPEVIVSTDLGVLVEQNSASIAAGVESALNQQWDETKLIRFARGRTWEDVAAEVEQYLATCVSGFREPK